MRSVKGPRSALTNYIEENGIKLQNYKSAQLPTDSEKTISKTKKQKKTKYCKPTEILNHGTLKINEEDEAIKEALENTATFKPNDELLNRIAMFLSRNRMMNQFYFEFLVENSVENLSIFDCSRIVDCEYVIGKSLKKLELFQCGQLTETALNGVLEAMPSIETLRITGGYLIENFNIPKTLRILDLTNCSRLRDQFIENINTNLERLAELRLSYCYGLSKLAVLSIGIERLFICETKLSEKFLKNIEDIKWLSVKRCPNINNLPKFNCIEYLDVEGIVTLTNTSIPESIKHLNVSYCYQLNGFYLPNLEYLDVSHINLIPENLEKILKCQKLKYLDVSWNSLIDDTIFNAFITNLQLSKLVVFGCFNLTKDSARLSYTIKDRCKVIGNPAETLYLLQEKYLSK